MIPQALLTPALMLGAVLAPLCAETLGIDLRNPDTSVRFGHLRMGGKNPAGVEIQANSRYLTLGGKPWFPVVGEFHFARHPRAEWEEELRKMKAGGVSVVASYVIWIYHEEEEGRWDWTGDRDLRAFVELCGKVGLYCFPRLGPWVHGEVRNGGLPDWLLEKCGRRARSDTEPYLAEAREFYAQIARQLRGLLWKDGGPVIGVQLENEMTNNPRHLLTLKAMARDVGIDVPLYTITGWMRVQVPQDEVLPVFGGYPDAFWARKTEGWARDSRVNYFFTHNRDDSTIGADLAKAGPAQASLLRYPYGTVELGGGMQVSYRRRPVIEADDVVALALTKLGSGSNMQGYYMYHGGANKVGRLSTLNESRASRYPNEMPVINYDFQAPLGQYGQKRASYDALRVQHLFLRDFGATLAPLPSVLPEKQPAHIDDVATLRWAARSDGQRGFLFINNYQRIEALPTREDVQFDLRLKDETLTVPGEPIRIPEQTCMIWPFNMAVGGTTLRYATAQPLCRVGDTWVFFTIPGVRAEFVFDPRTLADGENAHIRPSAAGIPHTIRARRGADARILILSQEQAREAWKENIAGRERLLLSRAQVIMKGDRVQLTSRDPSELTLAVYPPIDSGSAVLQTFTPAVNAAKRMTPTWEAVRPAAPSLPVKRDSKNVPLQPDDADFARAAAVWKVRVPAEALAQKTFLRIDYVGDVARARLGGRLVDDEFFFGRPWEIGLERFRREEWKDGLTLEILPLRKDAPIYIPDDRLPQFDQAGEAIGIRSITIESEYSAAIDLRRAPAR